uniref:T-ag OBD domain-containing protein n=1 Tax=Lepeophtheirus salmonis TaxID=72036 RepID=A0A0K2V4A1_LEPSM
MKYKIFILKIQFCSLFRDMCPNCSLLDLSAPTVMTSLLILKISIKTTQSIYIMYTTSS